MKREERIRVLVFLVFAVSVAWVMAAVESSYAAGNAVDESVGVSPARGVLERLIGERADEFDLKEIPDEGGKDVFEIEAAGGTVTVFGSSGVAICRGVYEYLREACGCQVSWDGDNLPLPKTFPDFPKTRVVSGNKYRQYFNVCTFGYTVVWWNWPRWEREIDWMALHGINMPLAMTAQESVWQKVWKEYGFTDEDLTEFFSGPAFLPWHRMGNLNAHAGPLLQSWLDSRPALQKKILQRERELGMTPITPAFSGFVPPSFARKFPKCQVMKTTGWYGFKPTFILNPTDPMFQEIGKKFIEAYRKEFGTDHCYLADSFNEMRPDVSDEEKLGKLAEFGESVLNSILAGDPEGTWFMQGWVFLDSGFWNEDAMKALFSKVPSDKMMILDLAGFGGGVWSKYNRQYILCIMNNYGHLTTLYGNLPYYSEMAGNFGTEACKDMRGLGIVAEGIHHNAVVYELLTDVMWSKAEIGLGRWLKDYCRRRYGGLPPDMEKAWELIKTNLYSTWAMPSPSYLRRPLFGSRREYPDPKNMRETIELFLACSRDFGKNDLYQRDLVDLLKHYLGDASWFYLQRVMDAWQVGDEKEFAKAKKDYLKLLDDIDRLLNTRPEYRLSRWINDARSWGRNAKEADLFEMNARMQLTVWGADQLYDYAAKEWSGLISDFYAKRYEEFFNFLEKQKPDSAYRDEWLKYIAQWELDWCGKTGLKTRRPQRDSLRVAKELFRKYKSWPEKWGQYSPAMGIAVGKPVTISGGTVHGHTPDRVVDGNAWDEVSSWHSAPIPQWICIDLEKPEKIDRVAVFNRPDGLYKYTVETSLDGENWTMAADMSETQKRSDSFGDMHKFKPVQARYVRVTVLFHDANPGIHMREVRVFKAK